MGKKYVDDFIKQPVDKMAQNISDMTYGYNQTNVPANHYKKILSKELMEIASSDINIEVNLIEPYYQMISSMLKENPKFFFKALLLVDNKIPYGKISSIIVNALENCWTVHDMSKQKSFLDKDTLELFDKFKSGNVGTD